jgi:hypothetical protein
MRRLLYWQIHARLGAEMNSVVEIVSIIICLLVVAKSYATYSAINWILVYGTVHKKEIDGLETPRQEDYFESFERNHADFFPFGVKDWRLRRLIFNLKSSSPSAIIILDFIRRITFTFHFLTIWVVLFSILVSWHIAGNSPTQSSIFPWQLRHEIVTLNLSSMVLGIFILAENVTGYWLLGNYPKYFHMLLARESRGAEFVSKTIVLLGTFLCVTAIGASAVFSSSILFSSFKGSSADGSALYLVLQSINFSTTTLLSTGSSNLNPDGFVGLLISILLQVSAVLFLSFLVSQFLSSEKK